MRKRNERLDGFETGEAFQRYLGLFIKKDKKSLPIDRDQVIYAGGHQKYQQLLHSNATSELMDLNQQLLNSQDKMEQYLEAKKIVSQLVQYVLGSL